MNNALCFNIMMAVMTQAEISYEYGPLLYRRTVID
jgi:hypothetical protein